MNISKDLDQFYTNKEVAKEFYNYLDHQFSLEDYFLIEPSSGEGAFSDLFHSNSISLDLDPKKDYIIKQDFFDFNFSSLDISIPVFSIGNPPFGKNSSLAVKFFNKSAEYSKYIAFIIPKTFKKVSVQNKLNLSFHLIQEIELQKNSFVFNNQPYDVPCVFQVWEKKDLLRDKVKTNIKSKYFDFVSKDDGEFAIRRVGGLAGKVILSFEDYKEPSHYFIKSKIDIEDLLDILVDGYPQFNSIAKNSAGNPSLSKYELITLLDSMMEGK